MASQRIIRAAAQLLIQLGELPKKRPQRRALRPSECDRIRPDATCYWLSSPPEDGLDELLPMTVRDLTGGTWRGRTRRRAQLGGVQPARVPALPRAAAPASARRAFWRRLLRRALLGAGLLGRFFRRRRLGLLGDFLADFLAFLADFLALLRRLLGGFLRQISSRISSSPSRSFLGLFGLLASFFFLPLAIVILLLPPINVYRAFQVVRSHAQAQSISSILAGDRLSPNREAQSCAPQELTYRRQSAPCIQYCPQQSCPA